MIGVGLGVRIGYLPGKKLGAVSPELAGRLALAQAAVEAERSRRRELDAEVETALQTIRELKDPEPIEGTVRQSTEVSNADDSPTTGELLGESTQREN